jgi:hypothetical protein
MGMRPPVNFSLSRMAAVSLKTVHHGHLNVHQHKFEPSCLKCFDGSLAVRSDGHRITALL